MLSESVTSYGYSMETLLVLSERVTSYSYSMETLLVLSESYVLRLQYGDLVGAV